MKAVIIETVDLKSTLWIADDTWYEYESQEVSDILEQLFRVYLNYFEDFDRYVKCEYSPENAHVVVSRENGKLVYFVRLSSSCRGVTTLVHEWGQELGHVLCGAKDGDKTNIWIEEVMTSILSLDMMYHMSRLAKTNNPIKIALNNNYEQFDKYIEEFKKDYAWDESLTISEFIEKHIITLEEIKFSSSLIMQLALKIFDLFKTSDHWTSLNYLNKIVVYEKIHRAKYLDNWIKSCRTEAQKNFASTIRDMLT